MDKINYSGIVVLFLLTSCAYQKEDFSKRSPESIHKKGMNLLKAQEFSNAASEFKDIEMLFPYSSKAVDGQILAAYSYYRAKKYLDAIRELEIFEKYHPAHEYIPYVMYLKAMCLFKQVSSVGRDSRTAIEAKIAFTKLANNFPKSKYHRDSIKKVLLLDNLIVAHEMAIARFYQKNKSTLSAIGRYNNVIAKYPICDYVAEAHFRVIECCTSIGLHAEAQNAYQVMKKNFPNDLWTKKADNFMHKNK